MKIGCFLVVLLGAFALSSATPRGNFRAVLGALDRFQTESGGFVNAVQQQALRPTLEATTNALFLSYLYGTRYTYDTESAARFIASTNNADGGFGRTPGIASDMESVRNAVRAYTYLGSTVPSASSVAKYIQGALDKSSGMFRPRAGDKANLQATLCAYQALEALGELSASWVSDNAAALAKTLKSGEATSALGPHFAFPAERDLSAVSANYHGIALAKYAKVDLSDAAKRAAWILSFQVDDETANRHHFGGFYTDATRATATERATHDAVASLAALKAEFADLVLQDALDVYLGNMPFTLREVADVHATHALTSGFKDNFRTAIFFDGVQPGNNVVQGNAMTPILDVRAFERFPHDGLNVDATISLPDGTSKSIPMPFDEARNAYTVDSPVATDGQLGAAKVVVSARSHVAGVGELVFDLTEDFSIGYNVKVTPSAMSGEQELPAGSTVSLGTVFNALVSLTDSNDAALTSSDYTVSLKVLDSSRVVLASQNKAASAAVDGEFSFSHTLDSGAVPVGMLVFRVEVSSPGSGVHSFSEFSYVLNLPFIASNIKFNGKSEAPTFKVGDKVTVTMEPATIPDMRTVNTLPAKIDGSSVVDDRSFVMEISTPSGKSVETISGVGSAGADGASVYSFETTVGATLSALGSHQVSFRYVTKEMSRGYPMDAYDAASGDYLDDAGLTYSVDSTLVLADVTEKPSSESATYGSVVKFAFKVKDTVSGQVLAAGADAGVQLALQHRDNGATLTSATQMATEGASGAGSYVIEWPINANAVTGAGVLVISAVDSDDNEIAIARDERTAGSAEFPIKIGGSIDHKHTVTVLNDYEKPNTLFSAEFELTSGGKLLKDAALTATVMRQTSRAEYEIVRRSPVATSPTGKYQVTWMSDAATTVGGEYKIVFHREIDRLRAIEAGVENLDDPEVVKPMLEIPVSHSGPKTWIHSLQLEWFVIAAAAYNFYHMQSKVLTTA